MGATGRKQPHAQKKLGDPASSGELAALRARWSRIVSQNPEILGGEPFFPELASRRRVFSITWKRAILSSNFSTGSRA